GLTNLAAPVDAIADFVEQPRREGGRKLRRAAVHTVVEVRASADGRKPASAAGLIVREAAVANEPGIAVIQPEIHLTGRGVKRLAEGRIAQVARGQAEGL